MSSIALMRLLAVGLFGLTMLLPPVTATFTAMIALGLMWLSLASQPGVVRVRTARLAIAATGALTLLVGVDNGAIAFPEPAGWTPPVIIGATLLLAVLVGFGSSGFDRAAILISVGLFVLLSVEVMVVFGGNLYGLDVYRSHESAAEAVRTSENPYTDAVTVTDGSPNAEPGDVIEGYSYPPVTLAGYVSGDLLAGDPRWASVVAVMAVLVAVLLAARRSPDVVAATLLMVAAVPLYRAIVWSGWTEPLSLALLVGGVLLWRRQWLSPVLLGMALASKQYLVVLVPVLVLVDHRPWKRSIVAAATAGLTLLPAVLADFGAFWFTMVERPLGLGFRSDTKSLAGAFAELGLDFEVPTWFMLVAVIAVGVALTRRVQTQADMLAGMSIVLAATFLLSLAFTNYWWLVQWLGAASVVASTKPENLAVIRSAGAPSA